MQCKIEGCGNRSWAANGLCLECACKVWWLAHRKTSDGQTEEKQKWSVLDRLMEEDEEV